MYICFWQLKRQCAPGPTGLIFLALIAKTNLFYAHFFGRTLRTVAESQLVIQMEQLLDISCVLALAVSLEGAKPREDCNVESAMSSF